MEEEEERRNERAKEDEKDARGCWMLMQDEGRSIKDIVNRDEHEKEEFTCRMQIYSFSYSLLVTSRQSSTHLVPQYRL